MILKLKEGQTGQIKVNRLPNTSPLATLIGAVQVCGEAVEMTIDDAGNLIIAPMRRGVHYFEIRLGGSTLAEGFVDVKPTPLAEVPGVQKFTINQAESAHLATLNINWPQGKKGDKGDKGDQGPSALDYARMQGYDGSEDEWLGDVACVYNARTKSEEHAKAAASERKGAEDAATDASRHEENAEAAANTATQKANEAATSERNAGEAAREANGSASAASTSEKNAKASETAAGGSATAAKQSEDNAAEHERAAKDAKVGAERASITAHNDSVSAEEFAIEAGVQKDEAARQSEIARQAAASVTVNQTHNPTSIAPESGAAIEAELNRRVGNAVCEGGNVVLEGGLTAPAPIQALQGVNVPQGVSDSNALSVRNVGEISAFFSLLTTPLFWENNSSKNQSSSATMRELTHGYYEINFSQKSAYYATAFESILKQEDERTAPSWSFDWFGGGGCKISFVLTHGTTKRLVDVRDYNTNAFLFDPTQVVDADNSILEIRCVNKNDWYIVFAYLKDGVIRVQETRATSSNWTQYIATSPAGRFMLAGGKNFYLVKEFSTYLRVTKLAELPITCRRAPLYFGVMRLPEFAWSDSLVRFGDLKISPLVNPATSSTSAEYFSQYGATPHQGWITLTTTDMTLDEYNEKYGLNTETTE